MIIQLPFSNDPDQIFSIQLGSATPLYSGNYQFHAYFNDRTGYWNIDISDANTGQVMVQGIPLVLGCDLIAPFSFGIGQLFLIDETFSDTEATFDSLGDTSNVYWISPDENLVADEAL